MGYYYGSLVAPFMEEEVRSLLREAIQSGGQSDGDDSFDDAKVGLNVFVKLLLLFAPTYSIKLDSLYADLLDTIAELEKNNVLFTKQIPKGKVRLYKQFHCYGSISQWKQCPEWKCPIEHDVTECPYFKNIKNPNYVEYPTITATVDENTQRYKTEEKQ